MNQPWTSHNPNNAFVEASFDCAAQHLLIDKKGAMGATYDI
jgi:hypothetical protein